MDNNTITITRKYTLIPTFSDRKEWLERIMEYMEEAYIHKIEYYEEKLNKTKKSDKENVQKIQNKLISLREQQKDFEENGTLIQANVVDYTYDLIRKSMASESHRKNAIIAYVLNELINREAQNMDKKERKDLIGELTNYAYRIKGSKKGESLFDLIEIDNPLRGYGLAFSKNLTSEITKLVNEKNYLIGKASPLHYKDDSPFTITKQAMSFSHDYDSYEELCEHIKENGCNLYFNFGGNGKPTIARFKINLGANRKNKQELLATILKIYSGEYQYCGSSIGIEKKKIVLYLPIKVPKQEKNLDENVVVGVDLGIAVPAMCALSNNEYKRKAIGSKQDLLDIRTQLQNEYKRCQKSLKFTAGGHGRKKKLRHLELLKLKEIHYVETYLHKVSKEVITFALANHAQYINIENLSGYDKKEFILRNWSYYKLQQYITYKAEKYGIIVRKINPCYTSQVCSVCGNYHPENRPKGEKGQAYFNCHNEECATHDKEKYKYGINADFNAARNIAMSTLWMEKGKVTKESMKEARKYYGIFDADDVEEENNEEAA